MFGGGGWGRGEGRLKGIKGAKVMIFDPGHYKSISMSVSHHTCGGECEVYTINGL